MRTASVLFTLFIASGAEAAVTAISVYPNKPIRVVVPFSAGSAIDTVARTVTQKLGESWRQQLVVDNRGGAGATIGTAVVAKSAPDGYTWLIHASAYATAPALYANLPYRTTDLLEVAPLATQPYVLVGPVGGAKSVAALITAAKANPGKLAFGSSGVGTATHLNAEKFRLATGIAVVHVPYKGGPEATADTITGRIAYWFPPLTLALPQVREGKLVALAVTGDKRPVELPSVPTLAESGAPDKYYTFWSGIWVPARTPPEVVDKIAAEVSRTLASPDVRERLAKLALEPLKMTSGQFNHFVRSEVEESVKLIKRLGLKPE